MFVSQIQSPRTLLSFGRRYFIWIILIILGVFVVNQTVSYILLVNSSSNKSIFPSFFHHQHKSKKYYSSMVTDAEIKSFIMKFQTHPFPYHILRNVSLLNFKRIVAIGDIHGDIHQFLKILQLTKCVLYQKNNSNQNNIVVDDIPKNIQWIAWNTILICTGDIFDRGQHSILIVKLLLKLRTQAISFNSLVFFLLGNHEIRNLNNEFEHTNDQEIQHFGGKQAWINLLSNSNLEIGYNLRHAPVSMIIGNTLFAHAGVRSKLLRKLNSIYHNITVNEQSLDILNAYVLRYLLPKETKDDEISLHLPSVMQSHSTIFDQSLMNMIFYGDGPLWTRSFEPTMYLKEGSLLNEIHEEFGVKFDNPSFISDHLLFPGVNKKGLNGIPDEILKNEIEQYMCQHLYETLLMLNVSRMIKGHDPQSNGNMGVHCNQSLFIIDVGLSQMYGGFLGALEIDLNTDRTKIYGKYKHF